MHVESIANDIFTIAFKQFSELLEKESKKKRTFPILRLYTTTQQISLDNRMFTLKSLCGVQFIRQIQSFYNHCHRICCIIQSYTTHSHTIQFFLSLHVFSLPPPTFFILLSIARLYSRSSNDCILRCYSNSFCQIEVCFCCLGCYFGIYPMR